MVSKQPSRKGTKAWRKNVDITDVEQAQEELRQEEMAGGRITERTDEQLFRMDDEAALDQMLTLQPDILTGWRQMKREKRPLTIDQIIAKRTSIPAILGRMDRAGASAKAAATRETTAKTELKKLAQQAKKYRPAAQLAEKVPARPKAKGDASAAVPESGGSLWDLSAPAPSAVELALDRSLHVVRAPKTLRRAPTSAALPALETLHPGLSYLPAFEDHQAALQIALNEELARIAEIERVQRNAISQYMKEDEEAAEEADADENELGAEVRNPATTSVRKTRAQRNKEKRRSAARRLLHKQRLEKQKLNAIHRIAELKAKLQADETVYAERALVKEASALAAAQKGPDRLGKQKFEGTAAPFQLTEDLAESLRTVVPDASGLLDRFKSFQKRGKIEPRDPTKLKRKYRQKFVERHSYKRFV